MTDERFSSEEHVTSVILCRIYSKVLYGIDVQGSESPWSVHDSTSSILVQNSIIAVTKAPDTAPLAGITHHARIGWIRQASIIDHSYCTLIGGTFMYTQTETRLNSWRGGDKRAEVTQWTERYYE